MADVVLTSTDATWVGNASNPVSLDNSELRRADSALFAGAGSALGVSGGVVRHGDSSLSVTVDASDVVTVQPGPVVIPGNAVAGTGCYRSALPASVTGTLAARDATNGRIDLVVYRMLDTDVVSSTSGYTARISIIAGTPAATPSAPALPSMAVELGRISVPASGGGSATVDSSYRTYAAAIGGTMYVPSSARLPGSAAKYQRAKALDTGADYTFNGTSWDGSWTTPTLGGGFTVNAAAPVKYRMDSAGNVHIRGRFSRGTGTSGAVLFTLPTGYAPKDLLGGMTIAIDNYAVATANVDTSGAVSINFTGTPSNFYLGNLCFSIY